MSYVHESFVRQMAPEYNSQPLESTVSLITQCEATLFVMQCLGEVRYTTNMAVGLITNHYVLLGMFQVTTLDLCEPFHSHP